MSSIYEVFTTTEVAKMLNITPGHVLRLVKSEKLSKEEVRKAGNRNHLFSKSAVEKLKNR